MRIRFIFSLPVTIALGFISIFSFSQQIGLPQDPRTWPEMMSDPNTSFWDTQARFKEYWQDRPVTKGSGYKAFKRWEYFMEPRVGPDGSWPQPDAVWQAMQDQPEMFETNSNMPGAWAYIGNTSVPSGGGGAGRINSVRELPGSTTTFFACAPGGGLWKTTNSGVSWSMMGTDFLASIGASDVAIDPTNTNIMYLATGDGDAGDTYALGVLKSTDGGNTWNTTGLNWNVTQSRSTNRIMINPSNTQIVICATSNGLYRTTDGGVSWTQEITGSFKDLQMKPGDSNTWYCCTDQFYKSTDGGNNWTLISAGLPLATDSQRMAIAVSAANAEYVYVLASGNDSGLLGVYKSTDGGTNFTQTTGTNPNLLNWDTAASAATGGQGWYDLRIEADPSNADIIFTGGVNVYKSINGGVNFALAGHWYGGGGAPYVHADIHAIHFIAGSNRLLVGCDGGVFTTTNGGPNFSDISSNLPIAQQYKLSVAGTNSNIVITGWQDNGTNLKNGAVHTRPLGGDGMDCQINPANASIMYGEVYYGSISKSTNGGANWNNIVGSGGANEDEDGAWVTPFVLGPNPAHIFVGKTKVFKSTDSGVNFTASSAFGGTSTCNDIAVAPSDANIVYASKGSALYKSIDNAATFTVVAGTQGSFISDIAIHNTDPNKVWVTFSNYNAGAKIYYTSNGGATWTNISGSLPNLLANAVAFQPGTSNGIYVGMDAGVYYRDDILGNFVPYLNSLPNVEITDIDIHTNTSTITVSSFGRGIWRAPLYTLANLDAVLNAVTSPSGTYCTTTVTPQLEVLNAGTSPIISMSINYQVTGQSLLNYNWVGSIATEVTTTITLPSIDYGGGSFIFNANIVTVNTLTDDNTANNSGSSSYYTVNATNTATLTLRTDCWSNETSWNITDATANVVYSGSGYASESTNTIPLCLPDGCFQFNIFDSYGDGLSNTGCSQGNGNYYITDNATSNLIVLMGSANFGTGTSHNFCYPLAAISGCMNPTACNYNVLATIDNGTCVFGPANDLCAGAITLVVNAAATATTNTTACLEGVNPSCGGSQQIKDVWYKFVYSGGPVTISTNFTGGTLTDTRIALYGTCGGALITCNDDISGSNYKSIITVACGTLTLGQTYYIQAGGYNSNTGTFSLRVTAPTETCNNLDDDCDGLIDEGLDNDGDGFTTCSGDCNDTNPNIYPGAAEVCNSIDDDCDGSTDEGVQNTYYRDQDGDSFGNISITINACSVPVGYVTNSLDCNDSNAAIKPGATEVCNTIDDDCDGSIDEGVQLTFYRDFDNDSYGNPLLTTLACTAPLGYVANNTDCNDLLNSVHPGAAETCNGIDDDCDTSIDEGVLTTFYRDQDNDTYGNISITTQACSAPAGYVANSTDCNDSNNVINPGATETCNGLDDNCNTTIDEGVQTTYYRDFDNDGYGNNALTTLACSTPVGYVLNNTDCNDSNNAVNPGATETCNSIDDDCDGSTDEGVTTTFYRDLDADGYGNNSVTIQACSVPVGYVVNNTDCNDSNGAVHPGATEICNTIDDNCNGQTDEGLLLTFYRDLDNDGFGNLTNTTLACSAPVGYVANSTDCNDLVNSIHPGATEICNSIDDDCDSSIDEGFDTDNDGYSTCAGDCNDNNNNIFPGAPEACNGIDDNCDSSIDNGVTFQNYYNDLDGDGFGNGLIGNFCNPPANSSLNNLDCNDGNMNVNPNASETCNGIDDDCNLIIDNGFDNDSDGFTSCNGDCNDNNNGIHPGAAETCNGTDDDCDTFIDEGVLTTFYRDFDNDTYGTISTSVLACSAPAGYVINSTDCNDNNSSVHPGAIEVCNNQDDDCDALIDEGFDIDGDGFTTCENDCNDNNNAIYPGATELCNNSDDDCDGLTDEGFDTDGDGYTTCNGDCNDSNFAVHPGSAELCNGIDDDCDTSIDDGLTFNNYYFDLDGDGYGSGLIGNFCSSPANASLNNLDCNDSNSSINPNAIEICNTINDDCDAFIDEGFDNDNDGFTICGGDCNDNVASVHPGAAEQCNNMDDDCDVLIDENLALSNWYIDADNDGYGSGSLAPIQACSQPAGYVAGNTDCNDGSQTIHPNAVEICGNGIDEDCNLLIDDGCTVGTAINDNMSTATSISQAGNIYPYCNPLTSSCLGSTVSPQGNAANVITGEDVWFRFTAPSPGLRVKLTTGAFDGVIEVHNAAGVEIFTENATGYGQPEILNCTGLTEGQQYYIAVRNYNSSLGNGTFTICAQALMDSNCDYGPGTYPICNNFKADWTAANFYVFNFTPLSGGATTSVTSTGYAQLGSQALGLLPGQSYNNTIDAVYYLSNGNGVQETIVVIGNESCTVTIAPQSDVQVKESQRCPIAISRNAYLQGKPNVCGSVGYEFEFTPTNEFGIPNGSAFSVSNFSGFPFQILAFNTPQSLVAGGYYSVRIRPLFASTVGTYGTPQCIHIMPPPSMIGAMDPGIAQDVDPINLLEDDETIIILYPNPTNGDLIQLMAYDELATDIDLCIIDSQGKIVFSHHYNINKELKTNFTFGESLAGGIYMAKFTVNGKTMTTKMMVQK